jgi:hypothetical protein
MRCRPVLGVVPLAAAAVGLAACGSASEGCSPDASYAAVVRFNEVLYTGSALPEGRRVSVGQPVGNGTNACGSEVEVRAITGVPPVAAVAVVAPYERETDSVYLAPGFVPALASHPLHAAIFGVGQRWTDDLRGRCRRPIRFGGVIRRPDGGPARAAGCGKDRAHRRAHSIPRPASRGSSVPAGRRADGGARTRLPGEESRGAVRPLRALSTNPGGSTSGSAGR